MANPGLSWEINITFPRRRAKARLYHVVAEHLELIEKHVNDNNMIKYADYDCFVLFPSQEMDNDGCTPVFVCEFLNGKVYNVNTEAITFVDTDERGEIVC